MRTCWTALSQSLVRLVSTLRTHLPFNHARLTWFTATLHSEPRGANAATVMGMENERPSAWVRGGR